MMTRRPAPSRRSFKAMYKRQTPNSKRRKLVAGLESLESRQLLAADLLFADSFESGSNSNDWNGAWVEDSQNDWFRNTQRATDGNVSAEVDGYAGNATLSMSNAVDLSDYESTELTFDWLIERGFDRGEYLALDISSDGGASWNTGVRQLDGNSDSENQWISETVDLSPYASSDLLVRFRSLVSRSNEDANVDNVKITGELSQPSVSIGDTIVTEGDTATSQFLDAFVTAGSGGLDDPRALKFGPDGNLYVPSLGTNSVLRYEGTSGAFLDEFVAPGDGGLDRPRDLVFDSNGDLLVLSGQNNQIIRYSGSDGSFDTVLIDGTGGLDRPQNATYLEASNELLISSALTNEILKYDGSTGAFLGTFVSAGDGGLDNPKWQLPTDSGDLLVVSQLGDQILKYSATGAFQEVLYSVPASQASTTILMGMVWGADGSLLVAEDDDLHAGRVIRLDPDSGGFLSEYIPIGAGGLDSPRGMTTDDGGNLYIASFNTDEILRYAPVSSANFTVSLSAASDQLLTVDYATTDGTATAGSDFTTTSGTLVFDPGETTQTIVVPITDDDLPEDTEQFVVNLSNPVGATLLVTSAIGTIEDDGDVGNQAPTADAGADQTLSDNDGTGSETVTLNGSGFDPDGSIVAYEWTNGATVLGTTATISSSLGVGTHTLSLLVTDNEGATASDTVVVTVEANQVPQVDAGTDQAASDGDGSGDQVVSLSGSGFDSDGNIVSHQWTNGATLLGSTADISPLLSVGTHILTLTVTDNGGATASDTVEVTIVANQAPTADAGDDQSLTDDGDGSELVTLSGSGSDSDGSIVSYQWSEGSTVLGNTASLTTPLDIGTHTLTLTVTDNGGLTTSDTLVVTVTAALSGPNLSHGNISSVTSGWQTVSLGETYSSAVIVATPQYNTNSGPGVVRVSNVTATSFDVRVDNAGATPFNGGVHFIAMEEGVYDVPGEYKLEAVKVDASTTSGKSGGWQIGSQSYQQSYSSPVVVGQVMSANDEDWSVFWSSSSSRTSPANSGSLNIGKHVGEDTDTTRATETLGYFVIESTSGGTIDGLAFTAGVGSDTIRGVGNGTYQYGNATPSGASTAVLSTAGMDGGDGGWAALMGSNPLPASGGSIDLSIDEDQVRDSERNHTTEQVAYFVIGGPSGEGESSGVAVPPITVHDPLDVNGDGYTSPIDALQVINALNTSTGIEEGDMALDTNGDGHISALDALLVVNRLNSATEVPANSARSISVRDNYFGDLGDDEEESIFGLDIG